MKIAIVGYSVEGKSSYNFFASSGDNELTIHDQSTDIHLPYGAKAVLGEQYLNNLSDYDLVLRTPGLRPQAILDKNPGIENKITSQLNEFMKLCPSKNILAVTGTKGKGTTSTLIARSLEQSGKKVVLGGNIGVPMLDLLTDINPDTYVVLELSSFQLIDFKQKAPKVAVCLMIVPEHLNWHKDYDEYVKAKSNLFLHQSSEDIAIYYSDNETSRAIASVGPAKKLLPYYSPPGAYIEAEDIVIDKQHICKTSDIQLIGKHNLQNVCAAVTAYWQFSKDEASLRKAITGFSGLEHNLELVRSVDGIEYFNDSFGTTPETAIAAIEAFESQEILILGGQPKNVSFDNLGKAIKQNENRVAKVLIIGEASNLLESALKSNGYKSYVLSDATTMPEIVKQASSLAGEVKQMSGSKVVVLLSTANTSFDMFKNYKDRGAQFKKAVSELI